MSGSPTVDTRPDAESFLDWPARLAREGPFLETILSDAPSRRVLDLGCGSGEHARWLAGHDFDVVAIDASEAKIEAAAAASVSGNPEYLLADMGAVERLVHGHFGAALCLGDTLPALLSTESVARMFVGLRRRTVPGAPIILQTLNYERVSSRSLQALPPRLRSRNGGTEVFLRLLEPRDDGIVTVASSLLRHRLGHEPPVEVIDTSYTQVRGWKKAELEAILEVARFPRIDAYRGFTGEAFDPGADDELVLVAR